MGYVPNLYFLTQVGLLHRQADRMKREALFLPLNLALWMGSPPVRAAVSDTELLSLSGTIPKKLTFRFSVSLAVNWD